jgi:hypothetical protein
VLKREAEKREVKGVATQQPMVQQRKQSVQFDTPSKPMEVEETKEYAEDPGTEGAVVAKVSARSARSQETVEDEVGESYDDDDFD